MRLGTAVLAVALFLPACATTPLPSKAAFSEQILDPLAAKFTDETLQNGRAAVGVYIVKWKKENQRGSSVPLLSTIGGLLGNAPGAAIGATLGHALDSAPKDDPDAMQAAAFAWLETRRSPYKEKVLTLWDGRIQETTDYFAVCIKGKERRYQRTAGFPRLDDGPGPCQTTTLTLND